MSDFNPHDYEGDDGLTHCAGCDAVHPASYQLFACDEPGCEVVGCHECMAECRVSPSHGWFCEDHGRLIKLGGISGPMRGCTVCEREQAEDAALEAAA